MACPSNSKRPVSGGKCKATEGKSVSPHLHQRKRLSQEVRHPTKAKLQPRALSKKPIRGSILQEKSQTVPQAHKHVQSQSVSPAQSVMAVPPLPNVVTSSTQSAAAPHLASLATVFKEMIDAAEMNQIIVPTMDKIEATYKHRQAALIIPVTTP